VSEPRNDIDTLQERIAFESKGVEVDLGNGVTGLAVNTYGSSPGCLLVDVIWWIDGIRHSERISERELGTTAKNYLANTSGMANYTSRIQGPSTDEVISRLRSLQEAKKKADQ
jgi:hypothetical protein